MSLQTFDVVPLKEQMMEKWNEDERLHLGARCLKVLRFTKEQQVYCVWWQWPYNEFDASVTHPIIYLPGRIIDVCIKNKKNGSQVTCINIEHEFTPGETNKTTVIQKLELDQCLFIAKHVWASETMLRVRQAASGILARYNAVKTKDVTLGGAMRKVALDMHTEQLQRGQPPASIAPMRLKQVVAPKTSAQHAWSSNAQLASMANVKYSSAQVQQAQPSTSSGAIASSKRTFEHFSI